MFKLHSYKQQALAELELLQCYLCRALTPLESSVVVARMYLVHQNCSALNFLSLTACHPTYCSNASEVYLRFHPMSCPPIQKSATDITSIQVAWRPVDGECPLQKDKRDKKRRKAGVPFTKFKKFTPPWPSGRTQRTKHQPCGKLHEHTWALELKSDIGPTVHPDQSWFQTSLTQPLQAIKPSISTHHLP